MFCFRNTSTARNAVRSLVQTGKAFKIRNNLYTCRNPETDKPIANRFQIASSITASSCVSHHSAMEYYGIMNQLFYDVYVSSETRFHDFEFDGYTYRFVQSYIREGIEYPEFSGGIKVTDRERTTIDSIKDMDKISGMEEVLSNIESMENLDEEKLLQYLHLYKSGFLFQKTGFLLWDVREQLGLSDTFFEECHTCMGQNVRYLTSERKKASFDRYWKLMIPLDYNNKNGVLFADEPI